MAGSETERKSQLNCDAATERPNPAEIWKQVVDRLAATSIPIANASNMDQKQC